MIKIEGSYFRYQFRNDHIAAGSKIENGTFQALKKSW